ncbi:MAG: family peptidase [Chitinophagaceae bacterium]|nr:family peptidase [Chitinophagaceae bacterium]
MKKIVILLLLTNSVFFCAAQSKLLTLEDALVNNRTTLAPENLRQLQFVYGTDDYVYLKKINNKDVWVRGNIKNNEAPFLSLEQLNQKLKGTGIDTITAMPQIKFDQSAEWIMTVNKNKIALNPVTGKIRTIINRTIADKENVEEGSAGYVAYLDNFNLYVSNGAFTKQVTTDGSKDIVYASSVHRDEFGITKGTFWSNNGRQLAFYRMDQSMVTDYPIIDWSQRPAKNVNIKYPMAGDKSHHVTVGIYNAETQSLVYVKTSGDAEQYLTNIAWSPDDKYLFIAVLNRAQNYMQMNQYEAASGLFMKTVFEEHDDKYVEPLVPVLFVKNNPSQFIWQSNRDGWNHLYLYSLNGVLLKQLTKGSWEVVDVKGFDSTGERLFYSATEESPITRNLYEVNLKTGLSRRITQGSMTHGTQVSTDGNFVIDNYSTTEIPRAIQLMDVKVGKTKLLLNAPNPLTGYSLGKLSVFTINNRNNTPLYCRMYKPVNFDSTKKYPVIVYWYGGSHAQIIGNLWNANAGDYWFQYMAERGYVVFSLDTRGSDNRGKAFEQSMFRRVGDVQLEDMMSGVGYLQSLPYVDQKNMGLFGWSFGGFNTVDFMLRYPDVFKAAVAGGPVTDWRYYEIMYTERYMDTPQENPEGYAATDLTRQVDKLKGKLLLIHGLQDPVVVQQNSVRFVRAAIDKNIQVDYMIYPGHEHNVRGKDREHLYQKVTDYFMQNLK